MLINWDRLVAMKDIGTNINSPTLIFFGVPGHVTSIGFVNVLFPDKQFSII